MDPEYSLQDVVRCASCEIPAPSLCCESCHLKLCEACGGEHVLDESKEHKVELIKRQKLPQYPSCHEHVTELCSSHCKQCDISLCTLCIPLETHKGHNVVDIFEIFQQKKETLLRDLQEMEQIICPKYQNIAADIPIRKDGLEENIINTTASVCKQGDEIYSLIDHIMTELKTEIATSGSKQLAALDKVEKDIDQRISEIKKIILDMKKLQDSNDISLISKYKSKNYEFKTYFPKTNVLFTNFSAPEMKLEEIQNIFGFLSNIIPEKQDFTINVPGAESSAIKSLCNEFTVLTSIQTKHGGYMNELLNVACLNDDEIWTCGNSTTLNLNNLKAELQKSIRTTSGNMPRDIAVTKCGDLVYADFKDKSLTIVKSASTNSRKVISLGNWNPRNICSTTSDDLLVSMERDKKQTKIVRFSRLNHKPGITIQFDDKRRPLFSHGGYDKAITENRNLDICVADFGAGELVVVNQYGKLRFRYTGSTLKSESMKSFHPRGVTTDSQSRILMSDHYNHCIHILDQNGQFIRHIIHCVQRPWGLCVDSRDNLFVAEFFSGVVRKIKYYRESN